MNINVNSKISVIYENTKNLVYLFDTYLTIWQEIMKMPIKSHDDFKTLLPLIRTLKFPIKIATQMNVLPKILYLKYAK